MSSAVEGQEIAQAALDAAHALAVAKLESERDTSEEKQSRHRAAADAWKRVSERIVANYWVELKKSAAAVYWIKSVLQNHYRRTRGRNSAEEAITELVQTFFAEKLLQPDRAGALFGRCARGELPLGIYLRSCIGNFCRDLADRLG